MMNTIQQEGKQTQEQQDIVNTLKQQQEDIKQIEYQLLPESALHQYDYCSAISFNKDASIVLTDSYNNIQVFELKEQKLKLISSLKGHEKSITCFQFMQKSNQFISASRDKKIMIWSQNSEKEWINTQTLEGHRDLISCLIINSDEDLIISGGYDSQMIFWSLSDQQWNLKQSVKYHDYVWNLSLNNSNTKLISYIGKTIMVFEKQGDEWKSIQQIDEDGYRIKFISDDEFVSQNEKGKTLKFYNYNHADNIFQITYEVQVKNGFEDYSEFLIGYVQSKQLLVVRNCDYLNILRKNGNGQFNLEQSIKFSTTMLSGCVSDDGEYLITWDYDSKNYQIRVLKEIK